MKQHSYFRPVVHVDGVKPLVGSKNPPFSWETTLKDHQASPGTGDALPASVFNQPTLGDFVSVIEPGLKIEVRIHDYDSILETHGFWIATVREVAGYRMLVRFAGMEQDGDEKYDFWISLGSQEVRHVGYCSTTEKCDLLPPNIIRKRQSDWCNYLLNRLHACKTFARNWPTEQIKEITAGRFKVGMRLELIDRAVSTRVRPGRILAQLGRRIRIQLCKEDCDDDSLDNDEDLQVNPGVWMDESSTLIFPVAWALLHDYEIAANDKYLTHCQNIKQAISDGSEPPYDAIDARPSYFNDWKENHDVPSLVEWKEGMRFECLDPLNNTFQELRMATCLKVLNDGYLKIGFDGPEMEEESIAIHSTSPLLFQCGYAQQYDIRLSGPPDMNMDNFEWKNYLDEQKAEAAPNDLFDEVPDDPVMKKFKSGAKLESTDLCEPHLICPATVITTKGRLVQVHFDGWEDNYDQLFDYRSHEFFPVGWCEIYGYNLEHPKEEEVSKKRKKK